MLNRGVHTTLMSPDAPAGGGGADPAKPAATEQPAKPAEKPAAANDDGKKTESEKVRLANELATTKAKLAEFEKAEADRAAAAAKADEDRKAKLKEEGDLKKLHEEALKDLEKAKAKLAEVDADVKLGRSARETYTKEVADGKAKLSAEQKSLVEFAEKHDIVQAAQLVRQFLGATTPPPTPVPGGGPPAPPSATDDANFDVAKALQDGMTMEEIQSKHPTAFTRYAQGFGTKTKVTSIFSSLRGPKKSA